jgi:hypothetical protein
VSDGAIVGDGASDAAAGGRPAAGPTLSKSDFKLARTCATKLYYRERRYPDRRDDDPYLDWLAEGGYLVEAFAKQLFPDGVAMAYGRDAAAAAAATRARLEGEPPVTLFEATLLDGLRLARVDVLRRSATGFDLYEVKSKGFDPADAAKRMERTGSAFRSLRAPYDIASDWREYLEDVTYQVTILKDLFPGVAVRAHLILVDKTKGAPHDGMPTWVRVVRGADGSLETAEFVGDPALARQDPLLASHDVTAEVAALEAEVRAATAEFLATLTPTLTRATPLLGGHCAKCEFRVDLEEERNGFLECWGARGRVAPHVLDLYQGRDFKEDLLAAGVDAITDVTEAHFAGRTGAYARRQWTQVEQTRRDAEWFDPALKGALDAARHPLHFIDFEAARIAIPHHRGQRPYGLLAFQWSCHTQATPGGPLAHREFLDLDPTWPNERFARALRDVVGEEGTLVVWSSYESAVLRETVEQLEAAGRGEPELLAWLRAAALRGGTGGSRQLDLLPLCRQHYFHPLMGGSNSIKVVLDAIWRSVPGTRARFAELSGLTAPPEASPYDALPPALIGDDEEEVREGTGAMRAYFRVTYGVERDDPAVVEQWSTLLRSYCRLDTLAMVLVHEHWRRLTGG